MTANWKSKQIKICRSLCNVSLAVWPLHAKCSKQQTVKQTPRLWCALGLEKKCEVKLGISSGCLFRLTGGHYWGTWIFNVLKLILGCRPSSSLIGLRVGLRWWVVKWKGEKESLAPTMLRACQFAKPIFLKAALNSNPLSLVQIQVSDVFCKEGELKGAPAGSMWKAISNRWQVNASLAIKIPNG